MQTPQCHQARQRFPRTFLPFTFSHARRSSTDSAPLSSLRASQPVSGGPQMTYRVRARRPDACFSRVVSSHLMLAKVSCVSASAAAAGDMRKIPIKSKSIISFCLNCHLAAASLKNIADFFHELSDLCEQ